MLKSGYTRVITGVYQQGKHDVDPHPLNDIIIRPGAAVQEDVSLPNIKATYPDVAKSTLNDVNYAKIFKNKYIVNPKEPTRREPPPSYYSRPGNRAEGYIPPTPPQPAPAFQPTINVPAPVFQPTINVPAPIVNVNVPDTLSEVKREIKQEIALLRNDVQNQGGRGIEERLTEHYNNLLQAGYHNTTELNRLLQDATAPIRADQQALIAATGGNRQLLNTLQSGQIQLAQNQENIVRDLSATGTDTRLALDAAMSSIDNVQQSVDVSNQIMAADAVSSAQERQMNAQTFANFANQYSQYFNYQQFQWEAFSRFMRDHYAQTPQITNIVNQQIEYKTQNQLNQILIQMPQDALVAYVNSREVVPVPNYASVRPKRGGTVGEMMVDEPPEQIEFRAPSSGLAIEGIPEGPVGRAEALRSAAGTVSDIGPSGTVNVPPRRSNITRNKVNYEETESSEEIRVSKKRKNKKKK